MELVLAEAGTETEEQSRSMEEILKRSETMVLPESAVGWTEKVVSSQ